MGERADSVKNSPARIEHEVREIRHRMEPVIEELDHRRHALTDWRGHLRKHRPTLVRGLVLVVGAMIAMRAVKRARSRKRRFADNFA